MSCCCCPYQQIDWAAEGGLILCNWPMCVQFRDGKQQHEVFRLVQENSNSIVFESEISPTLPPFCLLGVFSLFPIVAGALICAASAGYLNAATWTFISSEHGLLLEERTKYICQETSKILVHKVCSAFVEHTVIEIEENRESAIQGRLVISGYQAAVRDNNSANDDAHIVRVTSPWKIVDGGLSNIDELCEKILSLIPEEDIRVDVNDVPIITHPRLVQFMLRDSMPTEAIPPVVDTQLEFSALSSFFSSSAPLDSSQLGQKDNILPNSTITVLARCSDSSLSETCNSSIDSDSGLPNMMLDIRNFCTYRNTLVDPNCDVLTDECSSAKSSTHSLDSTGTHASSETASSTLHI